MCIRDSVALSEVWAKGGEGGIKLAEEVIRLVEEPNDFTYSYELEGTSIEDKLNAIVQKIYGGKRVVLTANAQKQAKELEALGFGNCPICVAKTQYSLTDDQTKLGAPTDFEVTVRNLKISAGADVYKRQVLCRLHQHCRRCKESCSSRGRRLCLPVPGGRRSQRCR